MDNKAFARDLEKRTRRFAVEIVRLSASLPNTPEARVVRNQLTKAGTSVGANYREANRTRSRADFRSRIKICTSEASEAMYWMEIIMEVGWLDTERVKPLYNECNELLSIFSAVVRSSGS